jgi:hypothetical protein
MPDAMDPTKITRRQFLGRSATGIGTMALASLLHPKLLTASVRPPAAAARAKRVIFLFQSGAPSQMELFDYKPTLHRYHNQDLPDSVRMGQRITGMTSIQKRLPVARSIFSFSQHGRNGTWISELLPHTAGVVDDLCIIRSMYTEAINHDPAMTFIQTGAQQPGRPSMGSWISYGLGSENTDLPGFIVLVSEGSAKVSAQPLSPRIWGSGFLPSRHQGVRFRSTGDPVLYLSNPPGIRREAQRDSLDMINRLNRDQFVRFQDPEIQTRIAQYEMAYRMQASVPDLLDTSSEPEAMLQLYGPEAKRPGTYASNCLLARRLAERGVRFIQLYHRGWDQHGNLPRDLALQCQDTDRASAALILDLKQRGLLDDTLIVWGGEFGRTIYCQGTLTDDNYGRDHHPRCFSIWLAGAGVRAGSVYGETDDFSYNILDQESRGVHVHDLQATILHLLGLDHEKLTFRSQGRDFRLTDVHGKVVYSVLT